MENVNKSNRWESSKSASSGSKAELKQGLYQSKASGSPVHDESQSYGNQHYDFLGQTEIHPPDDGQSRASTPIITTLIPKPFDLNVEPDEEVE